MSNTIRAGFAPDNPTGTEYTAAPEPVQRACRLRFDGNGITVVDPDNPGQYLHDVNNWWDGPTTVKVHDGVLTYTSPYSGQTDRFNAAGYWRSNGEFREWQS